MKAKIWESSNYCLSAVSRITRQDQWECYKYYRHRCNRHISGLGSIWLLKPPEDCFRAEYFFSLCLAFMALSPVSINSTAALSPPVAQLCHPSVPHHRRFHLSGWIPEAPTASTAEPDAVRHQSISLQGCAVERSRFLRVDPSQVTFYKRVLGIGQENSAGKHAVSVVLHVSAH